MEIIVDVAQGSPEWRACRLGIPTASSFDKILTATGQISKQRDAYMNRLAVEAITGNPVKGFQSDDMERGKEIEDQAISYYELCKGVEVQRVGFCYKDANKRFGASPDGLIGEDRGLELKCPQADAHVEYLLDNKIPTKYFVQIQGGLWITGRKFWDFESYYPGMKPLLIETGRDEAFIARLEMEVIRFCKDLEVLIERLK